MSYRIHVTCFPKSTTSLAITRMHIVTQMLVAIRYVKPASAAVHLVPNACNTCRRTMLLGVARCCNKWKSNANTWYNLLE